MDVIVKEIKEAKRSNMKIGVGSVVTAEVGKAEEETREGRSRGAMREVVACVHASVWKKKFLVQYEDRQKRDMGYYLRLYVSSKEEFGQGANETISDTPKNKKINCLVFMGIM